MEVTLKDVSFSRVITDIPDSDWGVSMYASRSYSEFPPSVVEQNTKGNVCYFMATGICLPADKFVKVDLTGNWKRTKYGERFDVHTYAIKMPSAIEQIEAFLKSGAIRGIGKKTAERVVQAFGEETLEVMMKTPEKLLSVRGIREESLEKIKSSVGLKFGFLNIQALLGPVGLPSEKIMEVYKTLGDNGASDIKKNPYCIMKVKGIGFTYADKTAKYLNAGMDSRERMVAAMQAVIRKLSGEEGHVYIDRERLIKETLILLNSDNQAVMIGRSTVENALDSTSELIILFPGELDAVLLPEYNRTEIEIAEKVVKLIKRAREDKKWKAATEKWQKEHPKISLTNGQKEGLEEACSNKILVITGGAGTGKTTVAKAVIESYRKAHADKTVTLLAPTGKAARRLGEATGTYASTIHSALKMQTGNGMLYYQRPLEEGLVIVDEVSMVDMFVMHALLCAITGNTTLVLLGDENQLPSVGPGAVLSELIRSQKVKVVTLTEIMRQNHESNIIGNAVRINNGDCNLVEGDDFCFIPADSGNIQDLVLGNYLKEVQESGMDEVAVLSPFRRKRITSTTELNKLIQSRVNPYASGGEICHGTRFCMGDKVIQTRNTDMASNGDVGYITSISSEKNEEDDKFETMFRIAFESGAEVKYKVKDMEDIDLAYALTIHKSQGSEYKTVIIPLLYEKKCPLYKRNLLYTGITRSRQKLIMIGQIPAVNACIWTKDTGIRNTLLANRIFQMCK